MNLKVWYKSVTIFANAKDLAGDAVIATAVIVLSCVKLLIKKNLKDVLESSGCSV